MMKPKKGETNAEMDEPMKNPLQLVKELVLLIVEARTPDLSVKGRVEGPHCPVIRGRPAHKCSTEKLECVRASEFCCLAQRLWLNSIPICLDILLFPDCVHGQEEISVTEGTVTKLSSENALLIERWTIDGHKRRQDDCLSSSMLIQAVRSYLHFSQISSWLYSTGGNLPGLLAYRVYAPGEVTSLDFLQTPDIHNFPVCLASFHHVRARVSSLQRQASVPILVCLQDQAMGNKFTELLCRNNSAQKVKSTDDKTENGHLKDFALSESSFMESLCASEISKKAYPSTAACSTVARKLKGSKKCMKSLQEASAKIVSQNEMSQHCPSVASTSLSPSTSISKTGNTFPLYEKTDGRHALSNDILARKARHAARIKSFDGGDHTIDSGDVLYTTGAYHDCEDLTGETSLDFDKNSAFDVSMFAPCPKGRKIGSSGLRPEFLNHLTSKKTQNKPPLIDVFLNNKGKQIYKLSDGKSGHVGEIKDGEKDFYFEQTNTSINMEKKPAKLFGEDCEYPERDEEDVQTLIRKKKKAEYSKFTKSLIEGDSNLDSNLEMWWPLQAQEMKEPPQSLLVNHLNISMDGNKISFPLSPRANFQNGNFSNKTDRAAFSINESKMLTRNKSKISQKEASEDEFIRILSDRLSVENTPHKVMCNSPKFSPKFQNIEDVPDNIDLLNNLTQIELKYQAKKHLPASSLPEIETASINAVSLEDTGGFTKNNVVQDSKISPLTVSVSRSPEDSDDTPIASPSQSMQLKLAPESLLQSVADKSVRQSCVWSHLRNSAYHESSLKLTSSSDISDFEFTQVKDSDTSLEKAFSEKEQIIDNTIEAQTNITPSSEDQILQIQLSDQNTFTHMTLLNHGTKFSDDTCLNKHGYVNEDPLVKDVSQPESRRIFEENLLPLVSYDADSDSFKKVEELYSSNILHSPKVLFSCDVPNTKMTSSRKCINFGDIFETEFFTSKISDMVNPEAIGKYMTNLAILSNSHKNSKEYQNDGGYVSAIKQVDDLVTHNVPSNFIEMSSRSDCFLKPMRDVQDMQADSYFNDLHSVHNYSLMGVEKDNGQIMKEMQNQRAQGNSGVTIVELYNDTLGKKSFVNKDRFNKTKRQLNLFETIKPSNTKKTREFEDMAATPDDVSLSALPDCMILGQNVQEQDQETTHCHIAKSEERSILFQSESVVTLSPVLSSSCSSSASSTSSSSSSVYKLSGSLSPTFPVTSPAYNQETFRTEKDSVGDNCIIDIQDNLNLSAQDSAGAGRQSIVQRKLQSDLKSNWRSQNNTESLISSSVTFFDSPASLSTTSSVSLNSTTVSAYPLPSSVPLSPPILHNASHKHLCHNKKNTPPSLSMVIIPQPSPQDGSDFDIKSILNRQPESNFSCDFQHGSFYDQAPTLNDLDSQRDFKVRTPQSSSNLFCDQPRVKHIDITEESTVFDQSDRMSASKNGKVSAYKNYMEETDYCVERLEHPQSNLYTDKVLSVSTQENAIGLSTVTEPTFHNIPSKFLPKTENAKTCGNQIHLFNSLGSSSSINTVIPAQIDNTEPSMPPFYTVSAGDNHNSKNTDNSRQEYNSSNSMPEDDGESLNNMRDITDSLNNISLNCHCRITSQTTNTLTTSIYRDSRLVQEDFEPSVKMNEYCSSLCDLNICSGTESHIQDEFEKINPISSLEGSLNICSSGNDLEATKDCNIEKSVERDQFRDTKNKTLDQHDSVKIIQTRQQSKNGFKVECVDTDDDDAGDGKDDVVFYISEPECKTRTDSHMSLLSSSLNRNVTSENCKPTRPSSLSAEINLEMRLRSNPGVGNKSNLDFSSHSRSPPFHNDNPGWSSVPPHRTVSTPSCMDRETTSKNETLISVIQQQNCDSVSHIGLRRMAAKSASMIFNNRSGLPTQSSPAPLKRKSGGRFDYDVSLLNTRAIKNAFSCSKLASNVDDGDNEEQKRRTLSTSAPASTNCLLGNFEESILNGRIDPVGTVDGFTAEIGASGSFCPKHLHLPVSAFFFALSDDNAPSPYLGHINLESVGKKGYHIPKKGTVQVTLFNPNKTVVKMFVVVYDLSDMPVSSQTFIRQRTVYSPIDKNNTAPSFLRYLIHLRCASSQSGKIYLHTDIRLIFARHKLDIDAKTIPYELKSYTEGPHNPKYSPKK